MNTASIRFGTDGWRDIIAEGFTFDNVALVGHALSIYLEESGLRGRPVLVGCDRRFMAENYAAHLAQSFEANNWDVLLADIALPTPVLAFGVKHFQAAGAVMLTASHNPYYYQGLKFIPEFAGPAMPETTDRITEIIKAESSGFIPPPTTLDWAGETTSLKQPYFKQLDAIINQHSLSSSNLKVMYNPMHGAGAGFLDEYLTERGVEVVAVNAGRNVLFGDSLPDPSSANLKPFVPALVEQDCGILFATDGDADRFGILDADGTYFGANQCLPLLADYLITYKHLTGSLVRTVATSHLLDGVAARHDMELVETAVGFKYVGNELRKGALIGGEESGGISIQGHIPEKDGILALVMILELISTSGESLAKLYSELLDEIGSRQYERVDEHVAEADKAILLEKLAAYGEDTLAGREIVGRNSTDGYKFLFKDGSWAMFRASGTEPVLRIYIEATEAEKLPKLKKAILELTRSLINS